VPTTIWFLPGRRTIKLAQCLPSGVLTRSPHDVSRINVRGALLLFYLKPKKDILAEPDLEGLQKADEIWREHDCRSEATVQSKLDNAWKQASKDAFKSKESDIREVIYLDGILFSALENKPRIVRVPTAVSNSNNSDGSAIHTFENESQFLGRGTGHWLDFNHITETPSRGKIQYPLILWHRQGPGSPPNRSIQTATKSDPGIPWKGNVLIMKEPRVFANHNVDVGLDDINIATEYFIRYKGKLGRSHVSYGPKEGIDLLEKLKEKWDAR
jgi:hypothetical protein